jgi:hypothetical protein
VVGIEVNGIPYAVNWTTLTNWSINLPLFSGVNFLTVQGVDGAGNHPTNRTDTITITNTAPSNLLPVVFNEWMAENVGPGGFADPADGLFQDWFELYNPNDTPVNLGGYHLTDKLSIPTKFTIPLNTIIAARGFLLVWADENGAQNSPTNAELHANFRLDNDGEVLGLFAPDGISPQHTVTFGTQFVNVSQGLFPDGAIDSIHRMTNWTPRASNRLGLPPSPVITALASSPGMLRLSVSTTPGRSYRVEYSDDLGVPTWISLGGVRTATAETLVLDLTAGPEPQRFFRIRLE